MTDLQKLESDVASARTAVAADEAAVAVKASKIKAFLAAHPSVELAVAAAVSAGIAAAPSGTTLQGAIGDALAGKPPVDESDPAVKAARAKVEAIRTRQHDEAAIQHERATADIEAAVAAAKARAVADNVQTRARFDSAEKAQAAQLEADKRQAIAIAVADHDRMHLTADVQATQTHADISAGKIAGLAAPAAPVPPSPGPTGDQPPKSPPPETASPESSGPSPGDLLETEAQDYLAAGVHPATSLEIPVGAPPSKRGLTATGYLWFAYAAAIAAGIVYLWHRYGQ